MTNIIHKLQNIIKTTSTITSTNIIFMQQFLKQHNYALLPDEFVEFLHYFNGISYNGSVIYGIYTNENLQDISNTNTSIIHPLHKDLVFLGHNDFDYLAYNQKHQIYQIIDKADFEVLEEYQDLSPALQHILKIDYE